MAGDLSSTFPIESAVPLHYRIDDPALVGEALGRCDDLLSNLGEAPGNEAGEELLRLYQSFDERARAVFFDGLATRFSVVPSAVPLRDLVARELTDVLRLLFHRSVLNFRQIDPEASPSLLERLIASEAVHPINDWREMARRLEADRRCYAFFHPAWPQEPLIFTEVALTRGIASATQPILEPESPVADPRTCDTAMFYSISNCQPGLRGFSLGNWLLNQTIAQLQTEMPWVRRFATISPIPGFRAWLSASATPGNESQDELLALCAHYLLRVKQGAEPADAVARFHIGNGARLHRLNPASDLSPAGIRQSAGLTANYVYKLNELEGNAETYRRSREILAGPRVARLAGLALPLLSTPPLVA